MSKVIFTLYILFWSFIFCEEQLFVDGIEELTLKSNMRNLNESLIFFDTNKGRFIQAKIIGRVNIGKVKEFYDKILPNLGWEPIQKNRFERKSEFLDIKYYKLKESSIVEFNIKPK